MKFRRHGRDCGSAMIQLRRCDDHGSLHHSKCPLHTVIYCRLIKRETWFSNTLTSQNIVVVRSTVDYAKNKHPHHLLFFWPSLGIRENPASQPPQPAKERNSEKKSDFFATERSLCSAQCALFAAWTKWPSRKNYFVLRIVEPGVLVFQKFGSEKLIFRRSRCTDEPQRSCGPSASQPEMAGT